MKKESLPIGWVRWRRRRYQSLAAQGLASDLAWQVAAGEAKGRHRISRIVGNQAARDAELECISVGGKVRFVLVGDSAGLTEKQLAAVEELNRHARAAA